MRFVCLLATVQPFASPQPPRPPTPAALADTVLARFARRDTAGYNAVMPFDQARQVLRTVKEEGGRAETAIARVVRSSADQATLLLAGTPRLGNSGDETSVAAGFSGLYLARRQGAGWMLDSAIAPGSRVTVREHRLHADLEPGSGLTILDSVRIDVRGTDGALFRLNHTADVAGVERGGRTLPWAAGGGVVWLDVPPGEKQTVVFRYRLSPRVDDGKPSNSGRFGPDYGHVRNQYYWHPMIWFDDGAVVRLTVTAPANFQVATDLPQKDSVVSGRRVVTATSADPVGPLTLAYDCCWSPRRFDLDGFVLRLFATANFTPPAESLATAFVDAARMLSQRFGSPHGSYRAIVQMRARPGAGWPFMSNAMIAANRNGGSLMVGGTDGPRAFFGHEVSHAWTQPTGPAQNFLREGWATFAEALLLREHFGPAVERAFWAVQRQRYFDGNFEGRATLLNDPGNGGAAYSRGSWVFRMLADEVGDSAFALAVRRYRVGGGGIEAFVSALGATVGRDLGPWMNPWLETSITPQLAADLVGGEVRVQQRQEGPVFPLRLTVRLRSGADSIDLSVRSDQSEARVPLPAGWSSRPTPPTIVLDPDGRVLFRPVLESTRPALR